jgi:hypothetical protein
MELIILAAIVVGIPVLLFGTSEWFASAAKALRRDDFAGRSLQLKLWHVVVAVALFALLFAALAAGPKEGGFFLFLTAMVIVGLLLHTWRQEFVFLMSLRDDDFPGRHDKLIWTFMLTAMAPIGLWFFRSYRLSHWPEPKPDPDHARTAPEAL